MKKIITELRNRCIKQKVPMFLVTIEQGKQKIYSVTPEELGLYDEKSKKIRDSYDEVMRIALDFKRKDYE